MLPPASPSPPRPRGAARPGSACAPRPDPRPHLCTAPSGPRRALPAARLRRCTLRSRLRAPAAALAPPREVTLAAGPPGAPAAPGALGPRPRPARRPRGGTPLPSPAAPSSARVPGPAPRPRPPASSFSSGTRGRRQGARLCCARTLGEVLARGGLGRAYKSRSSNSAANPLPGGGD